MSKDSNELPVHYRYVDHMLEDGIHLVLQKMYPIRQTKCFYMCLTSWDIIGFRRGAKKSQRSFLPCGTGLRRSHKTIFDKKYIYWK